MYIQFNGQKASLPQTLTLACFLKNYAIEPQTPGIAVAVNGQIVFRADWSSKMLVESDQIELVHAVSGG